MPKLPPRMVIIAIIITHHAWDSIFSVVCMQTMLHDDSLFLLRDDGIVLWDLKISQIPRASLSKCQSVIVGPHHCFIVVPSMHFLDQKKIVESKLNHIIQSITLLT
jgi:hypothetical protein